MLVVDLPLSKSTCLGRGLILCASFGVAGCTLASIEPDEIDVAEDTTDGPGDGESGDEGGSEGDLTETGLEDESGDDAGDDFTSSGSDTGAEGCLQAEVLELGENAVSVGDGTSDSQGSCGGVADESYWTFTASAAGDYTFSLESVDFDGVLYSVDDSCAEVAGTCIEGLALPLGAAETVIIVVDAESGSGSGTLTVSM